MKALIPIVFCFLVLGFYRIESQSLWTDEVLSLRVLGFTLEEHLSMRRGFLYFMALDFWAQFGNTVAFLRSLSVIFGALAVVFSYSFAYLVWGPSHARISGILLATSPLLIWFSQDVRYVAMMIAVTSLCMLMFYLCMQKESWYWWLLYGLSATLMLFTFIGTITVIGLQGMWLVFCRIRKLKSWVVCQLILLGLFFPWLNEGFGWVSLGGDAITEIELQISPLRTGVERAMSPAFVPYTFFTFSSGYSMGPSIRELHEDRSIRSLMPFVPEIGVILTVFGIVFVMGLRNLWLEGERAWFWLVAFWCVVPVIGILTICLITGISYNVRYASMALPGYLLILGAGLNPTTPRLGRISGLIAILSLNGFSVWNYQFNERYVREDTKSAAAYLEANVNPEEFILVIGTATAIRFYYEGENPMQRLSEAVVSDPETLKAALKEAGDKYRRVWLVSIRPWQSDPRGITQRALDEELQFERSESFPGVEVRSYRARSAH